MHLNRFQRHTVALAIAASVFTGSAWAVDPFTVRDIRIEGLQRTEAGTIFASLPVRVGDTYDDQKGAAAIQAIFALGLFKDVRIDVSGDVLVVIVEERPTVADVEFSGNKEFDKDALRKMMRDIGLADGRPYDKALLDRAEQEIKRQYINRSLYASEVVTTVTATAVPAMSMPAVAVVSAMSVPRAMAAPRSGACKQRRRACTSGHPRPG